MTTKSTEPAEDRALVLRAQDGDVPAFEQLVDRYQGRLFRIAYATLGDRAEAEDVTQETFLVAWRRLHLLTDPDGFRAWISTTCARRATDVLRRRARRSTDATPPETLDLETGTPGRGSGAGEDPAHHAVVHEQLRALADVLARIDPDLRACWVLREVEGMSYPQIGATLGLPEPTVRGRISRARALIIRQMHEWR